MSTSSLFTPIPCTVGGLIIGLAASVLLLANGDVLGASGITNSIVLQPRKTWESKAWKLVFVSSFIIAAIIYTLIVPDSIVDSRATQSLSIVGWIVSGLLVGFGTKLGNGCTSGHGVCGMARLSLRSFTAIGVAVLSAIGTATILSQQVIRDGLFFLYLSEPTVPKVSIVGMVVFGALLFTCALCSGLSNPSMKMIGASIAGALFAVGLAVAKMVLPSKVIGFADLSGFGDGTYDPSLLFVMAGAVAVSFLSYQYKNWRCEAPICAKEFSIPTNTVVDVRLLIGAAVFGVGWGFGGVCPGPALFLAANGSVPVLYAWMPSYLVGSFLATLWKQPENPQQETEKDDETSPGTVVIDLEKGQVAVIETQDGGSLGYPPAIERSVYGSIALNDDRRSTASAATGGRNEDHEWTA